MFARSYLTHRLGMVVVSVLAMSSTFVPTPVIEGDHILPYAGNPYYWQYRGEPIMLIGASDKDNLWQWTGTQLTEHLDLMKSMGGNYVRNTMSDRSEGDLFAARHLDDGRLPPRSSSKSSISLLPGHHFDAPVWTPDPSMPTTAWPPSAS